MLHDRYLVVAAFGAALVLTLILAALVTPRSWWRRPTLRTLALVAIGTWGLGTLMLGLVHTPAVAQPLALSAPAAAPLAVRDALRELQYRVHDDLNLRAAKGVAAPRIAVVPAGALVTTTGVCDGDWWQVRARIDGKNVTGWSSSLWLRRAGE